MSERLNRLGVEATRSPVHVLAKDVWCAHDDVAKVDDGRRQRRVDKAEHGCNGVPHVLAHFARLLLRGDARADQVLAAEPKRVVLRLDRALRTNDVDGEDAARADNHVVDRGSSGW